MEVKFRQIMEQDFDAVHDLALEGWLFAYGHIDKVELKKLVDGFYSYDKLRVHLDNVGLGKQFFLLAFCEDELVGFCSVIVRGKIGELLNLYIKPELIGRGLGKSLLKKGENFLKKKGVDKYFTFVNKHNEVGFNFYIRNGFEHFAEKDEDDEFEVKVLWCMEKKFV